MTLFYEDPMVSLYQGDVRAVLRELPAESVQTVVTSPPLLWLTRLRDRAERVGRR